MGSKFHFTVHDTEDNRIGFYQSPEDNLWYFGKILIESDALFEHKPIGGFHDKSIAYQEAEKLYNIPSWKVLKKAGKV